MNLNTQPNNSLTHCLPAELQIDWNQLSHLSEGNQEFEIELLKIFFVETKTRLQLLSMALESGDRSTLEHLAHQIKGSSGNLGFMEMYRTASQLEQYCKCPAFIISSPHLLKQLLEQVIAQLTLVQGFLEANEN